MGVGVARTRMRARAGEVELGYEESEWDGCVSMLGFVILLTQLCLSYLWRLSAGGKKRTGDSKRRNTRTMNEAEFWAKLCAIQSQLSVVETLLLRLYELMQHFQRIYPPATAPR